MIIHYNGRYLEVTEEVAKILEEDKRKNSNTERKLRRIKQASLEFLTEVCFFEPADDTDIEKEFILKEEQKTLFVALKQLSEKQRQLIHLHFWEKKTEREIAKLLGVSHQAINQQLHTILRNLKKVF